MDQKNLTLITPSNAEPVTLDEAKLFLNQPYDDDDDYIKELIETAREYCEEYQRRAYITQTWELALEKFHYGGLDTLNNRKITDVIEIPFGSLQKINSFTWRDAYGTVTELTENIDYIVSARGIIGRVCPPFGKIFPASALWPLDPIVINFTCGYGDTPDKVPRKVKQAMKMLIAHWYGNRMVINELRSSVSDEIAFAVTALLSLDRIITL